MVATKRGPLADVEINSSQERTLTANDAAGSSSKEPLGGFIFVCNNDTMDEDRERLLFGMPQRYQDVVKAIQPGLPLFLYNYSTRFLYGVFEASSYGALNIEPDAYGEIKDVRKNGRQLNSRFPAQVRVRLREQRPPLEEDKFRPILYHYDGPKFRLQLSKSQVQELLKLFGAASARKMEDAQEDSGGEWERVKTKSKAGRNFRATVPKGSSSPNATAGNRRRGGNGQNGSNSNGGTPMQSNHGSSNSVHEPPTSRGRERDTQQSDISSSRWRVDSDSWSGSSSAGTASSSGVHDEDRPKKGGQRENGFIIEMIPTSAPTEGGYGFDGSSNGAAASSKGVGFMPTTKGGLGADAHHKVGVRLLDDDSNEIHNNNSNAASSATTTSAPSGGTAANSNARSGFVSYSAALKSGMLAAVDNANGEPLVSPPEISPYNSGSSGSQKSSSVNSSYSSAAAAPIAAPTMSPSSPGKYKKGDSPVERIDGHNQKADGGLSKARYQHGEVLPSNGNQGRLSPAGESSDSGKQEGNVAPDTSTGASGDGTDGKKSDRAQPWGKPMMSRATPLEIPNGQNTSVDGTYKSTGLNPSSEGFTPTKKSAKDAFRSSSGDAQVGEPSPAAQQSIGSSAEVKDCSESKSSESDRKNAWQSNDRTILRLLHDPDPAVNSSLTNGRIGETEQGGNSSSSVSEKQLKEQIPPATQDLQSSHHESEGGYSPVSSDLQQSQIPREMPSSPVSSNTALSPHGFQSKSLSVEAPIFQQQSRPSVHEVRRRQYDNQKHDKHQEERQHFRKQHGHPQDHLQQHAASMLQTHSQQIGYVPLQIPTSLPGMPRHHHHPILSSTPQTAMLRDRSRSRAVVSGSGEYVHSLAAHGSINKNLLDAESAAIASPLPPAWAMPSPVLFMQHFVSPTFMFSTPAAHMLVNAEELHNEIKHFALTARPSSETRVHAEVAVECVRGSVKQLWPEADVEVFGSFATGLCLHHSDVDVVVVDTPEPDDSTESFTGARLLTPLIRCLASALKDNKWCEVLNTIETASMPVIKLRCTPEVEGGITSPVAIDITIGGRKSAKFAGVSNGTSAKAAGAESKPVNPRFEAARSAHNGAAAREFVIERLKQLPALFPLVLLLKSFLRSRNLNDVYSGGLGSFALTLMLVFYLERVPISCGSPQDGATSSPPKSPSPAPSNTESGSAVSVDMSQPSLVSAFESVDSPDDKSLDLLTPTSTPASTAISAEVPVPHESTASGDPSPATSFATVTSSAADEPLSRRGGGLVEDLVNSMDTVASPNLGILLIGFLQSFGQEIDFSRVRLALKGKGGNPGGLFWHEKNARTLPLWIDDPLRPDAIIGAGSFNIWQVQGVMREMLYVITKPQPMGSQVPSDDQNGEDSRRTGFFSTTGVLLNEVST